MAALVSARLNEAFPVGPTFFPTLEIVAALNEGQRVFCLLTLALERTAPWTPAATFTHALATFPDYIAPLRVQNAAGAKIRPARLADLWALDSQWPTKAGPAQRYAAMGADLCAVYGGVGETLAFTYARSPVALAADGDVPEVPEEYHPMLVSYGIYRMRMVEGGEPFKGTLPLLAEFLEAATGYASFMRGRNIGSGYDTLPFELASFDISRLVGLKSKKTA